MRKCVHDFQLVEWDDSLSIGDPRIDGEHRHLFSLTSRLADHLATEDGANDDVYHDTLTQLIAYAKDHFAHEETLMASAAEPTMPRHVAAHRQFEETVRTFLNTCADTYANRCSLCVFLDEWIRHHILGFDMQLSNLLGDRAGHSESADG